MAVPEVKALIFDVFGTVVDWRNSIIDQSAAFGKAKGIERDWADFADSWRGKYRPYMNKVRTGELPWTNLDGLHRLALEELLEEFEITGLSEEEKQEINFFWHHLRGWADSAPGLWRLKHKYIVAPMSNGNLALMTNMGKYAGLPWDCILGAELAQHYKPDPESYLTAVKLLGLRPDQVMMTAAHQADLLAAGRQGLRMGFVTRPQEFGYTREVDITPDPSFHVVASDFVDLAAKMGT